jgi:Zn-finger nucleic acid-binding protein
MFQGAKHCSRCGAEAARQAVEKPARNCPECRSPMVAVAVGATTLDECGACGGVFVDKPTFDRICTEREQQAVVLQVRLKAPRAPASAPRADRYWPCPDCGQLMNRQNFARISGVVLDVCRNHGVWFNHGELTRLVEFIRGGGLSRARDREIQDVREERERLQHEQRIAAIRTARLPEQGSGGGLELGSLFSLFDDIFFE